LIFSESESRIYLSQPGLRVWDVFIPTGWDNEAMFDDHFIVADATEMGDYK
jgi:hypothetical protein